MGYQDITGRWQNFQFFSQFDVEELDTEELDTEEPGKEGQPNES